MPSGRGANKVLLAGLLVLAALFIAGLITGGIGTKAILQRGTGTLRKLTEADHLADGEPSCLRKPQVISGRKRWPDHHRVCKYLLCSLMPNVKILDEMTNS